MESLHKYIIIYLILINIVTLIAFVVDKYNSINGNIRIPNKWLFVLMFIGGTLGAYIGMKKFRHKSRKIYFTLGIKIIVVLHVVIIIYIFKNYFK